MPAQGGDSVLAGTHHEWRFGRNATAGSGCPVALGDPAGLAPLRELSFMMAWKRSHRNGFETRW
jgi:hypothetical protein